jgi:hypothetical protein
MDKSGWFDRMDADKITRAMTTLSEREFMHGGRDFREEAHGDEWYALWLVMCDVKMLRMVGLGIFDIADWGWADGYESEMSPGEAVREALSADDTFGAVFG